MKKWIPLTIVLLVVAGAVAVLLLLPDRTQGPAPLPAPQPPAQPSSAPETIEPDEPLTDDSTDSDQLPRLPTIDEDEKEYPTPFAPPEEPGDVSSSPARRVEKRSD